MCNLSLYYKSKTINISLQEIPMQTETLAFVQYWRNSLADAETSKGAFRLQDCGAFLQLSPEALASGIASAEIVEKCFADEKRKRVLSKLSCDLKSIAPFYNMVLWQKMAIRQ